jgi:hypothetical protein
MKLRSTGTAILAGDIRIADIDPARAAAVLEERGARAELARQIASGALAGGAGVRSLARQAGLIAVETDEARRRGLLQ